jgi:hypothetical protein
MSGRHCCDTGAVVFNGGYVESVGSGAFGQELPFATGCSAVSRLTLPLTLAPPRRRQSRSSVSPEVGTATWTLLGAMAPGRSCSNLARLAISRNGAYIELPVAIWRR